MVGDLCLAIDLGTGGPKIGLVALDGDVLDQELHSVVTTFAARGAATQDANEWWSLVCTATRRLVSSHEGSGARIVAIAVTGQWASTVPVDANGVPTGPCVTWQDTRGGRYVRELIGGRVSGYSAIDVARWIRKTGGAPSTSGADPVGHILYLMNEEPQQVGATRWFLEPVDYLTMRFCGEASATHASMQGSWLTDNRQLDRFEYDPDLLGSLGLAPEKLPPLRATGSIVATVRADVADDLGIRRDAVVITGLPDLQAASLGAGATRIHSTHLALSTTSWISCPVAKKKTDISHSIATVPGLTSGQYLVVNNQDTGAKTLDWLRGLLGGGGGTLGFDDLTAMAATSPSGSNGVVFTPWLTGERSPVYDSSARGGFNNLSITNTTPDLIRSVLEGVAFNSAWLFGYVEKFCGTRLEPVRLLGGGAQSSLWCQIMADVLNRTVEQVPDPMYAQLRGMASLASVALGERSLDEIESSRVPGRMFEPDKSAVAIYEPLAQEFQDIYSTSKARFRRMNKRT